MARPAVHIPRKPFRAVCAIVLLPVLATSAACGDLATSPLVEVTTSETVPTLQLDPALPTFPDVVERWGGTLPSEALSERWSGSWSLEPSEGSRVRDRLYRALAPELARSFSLDALEPLERRLEEAIASIMRDLSTEAPETLLEPVARARSSAADARKARVDGDIHEALRHLLVAVDHLHSATAEAIAGSLLREGEDALRRISSQDSYPEQRRDRAERLLIGAREALEDGDGALALRRAYYGHQLLTGAEVR